MYVCTTSFAVAQVRQAHDSSDARRARDSAVSRGAECTDTAADTEAGRHILHVSNMTDISSQHAQQVVRILWAHKCTVHILCLYGDTVRLKELQALDQAYVPVVS
jgi:hypothetical protein